MRESRPRSQRGGQEFDPPVVHHFFPAKSLDSTGLKLSTAAHRPTTFHGVSRTRTLTTVPAKVRALSAPNLPRILTTIRKGSRMKRLIVIAALLAAAGCSGSSSPTAPTPAPVPQPAQIAGNYTGTWQATQVTGGSYLIAYVMVLNQSGANVTGTWSTAQANGTVNGTTTPTTVSGTMTWNGVTNGGTPCTGTFAFSGNAGGATATWGSPAVTANCTNLPTGITIAAQLR